MRKKFTMKLKKLEPYGFILPIGIILLSFYVLPLIISGYFSFTKYNIMQPPEFLGLENYKALLKDKVLKDAMGNTLYFAILVVPIQTVLSLGLAYWLTKRAKSKLNEFVKGVMFIPVITSSIVVGIVWRILINGDFSPINVLIELLGFHKPDWLGSPKLALPTLMGITIWKNVGYFMVIYISGLMDIPRSYYEAAKVDGASGWDEFRQITIPMLRPTTVMVVFLGTIWSLQTFDLVFNMTGGGPGTATMTLTMHIYNLIFKNFNVGYAMSVANVLIFIIACISIVQKRFLDKNKYDY